MDSTDTLTSLAILKVTIDEGGDYFDYLRPFVLQVLVDHRPNPVEPGFVGQKILDQFGLEIPIQTIELVLFRINKRGYLKRNRKRQNFRITRDLPDPQIEMKKGNAQRHINAIVNGLEKFSQDTPKKIDSYDQAINSICGFLKKFDISCIRAFLRGTVIPQVSTAIEADVVLVSNYVKYLQENDPDRFSSFQIVVQGHMLANALLSPDLARAAKNYKEVTFYFDTPLLVQRLGLESKARQSAVRELIDLIYKLGGTVAIFEHSRQELENVLRGAAANLNSEKARGVIVHEARKRGTTISDFLLIAETLEKEIRDMDVEVRDTPDYITDYQIDEVSFEHVLQDEISYYNPRAKAFDINSVRSIYALRRKKKPTTVEKAKAILVTSNISFAKAAWEFGKQHQEFKDISSVITDFSLANMAWLKLPMQTPGIPQTQLLAMCYAAMEPSNLLLGKYMAQIEKLEKEKEITPKTTSCLEAVLMSPRN